jgi:hypothetical protein
MLEVDYIEESNGLYHVTFLNNNCESTEIFEANTVMGFVDNIEDTSYNEFNEKIDICEDGNKKVKLNKIMAGDVKKYKVFVKNDRGNVVKVNFGDPNMEIKRDNPARKSSYRARHNCDNPGPKYKANYWSCKMWSAKPVSEIVSGDSELKNYMFFRNLKTIKSDIDHLLSMDEKIIDAILSDGHDWANNEISTSTDGIKDVHSFLMDRFDDLDQESKD